MAAIFVLTQIRLEIAPKQRYDEYGTEIDEEMDSDSDTITIKDANATDIGYIRAHLIDRRRMRGQFWTFMDLPILPQELTCFSTTLFYRDGRLKRTIRGPQVNSEHGSGVFGEEMDIGPIAYIESFEIFAEYRGRGVGQASFAALRKLLQVKANVILQQELRNIFCWLIVIDSEDRRLPNEEYIVQSDRIVAFFHKLDFRRVGRSKFFAYSFDPSHASKALPAENDVAGHPHVIDEDPQSPAFRAAYPLHHFILNHRDTDDMKIDGLLLAACKRDPSSLLKVDQLGNNALHLAACFANYTLVNALLELDGTDTLLTCENALGQTPITMVGARVHSYEGQFMPARRPIITTADQKSQLCFLRLRIAMGIEDCGCAHSWMSPKLRFMLLEVAEEGVDLFIAELSIYSAPPDKFALAIRDEDPFDLTMLQFTPPHLRPTSPDTLWTFCKGFAFAFAAIAAVLESGRSPTISAAERQIHILARQSIHSAKGTAKDYYQYQKLGGTMRHAMEGLIEHTEDRWNDKQFENEEIYGEEFTSLPECDLHDIDFDRARAEMLR